MPRLAILLTTFNRPHLLAQSLPQIEREANRLRVPLVISDDHSTNIDTAVLLEGARSRGVDVIQPAQPRGDIEDPHHCIQKNNLFAFDYVLQAFPDLELILKVDDDVVMIDGAFSHMLATWDRAKTQGLDVLTLSGIRTINEPILQMFDGYAKTSGSCNAAVIYQAADWKIYSQEVAQWIILAEGFDCAFLGRYANQYRPLAMTLSLVPSVVYHTGLTGVHTRGADYNVDYAGSLGGVVTK